MQQFSGGEVFYPVISYLIILHEMKVDRSDHISFHVSHTVVIISHIRKNIVYIIYSHMSDITDHRKYTVYTNRVNVNINIHLDIDITINLHIRVVGTT